MMGDKSFTVVGYIELNRGDVYITLETGENTRYFDIYPAL